MLLNAPPNISQLEEIFMSSGPSVAPQAPVPPKSGSGLKVLLWILGGIAAFFVLCIIAISVLGFFIMHKAKQAGIDPELMKKNPALATAKLAVAANPDVELVSSNDNAGTVVVRDKKTGKTMTMKFDPQKKTMVITDDTGKTAQITADTNSGTLEMKGPDGSVKLGTGADKAPSWVPVYPGATPQSTYSVDSNGKQSGSYSFVTSDSADKVVGYYGDTLTSGGFEISKTMNTQDGKTGGMVSGSQKDGSRSVLAVATPASDGLHVNVSFEEKKQQ